MNILVISLTQVAKVFLLTTTPRPGADPHNLAPFHALHDSAVQDRFRRHVLTDDPAAADLIIFAESLGAGFYFGRVRKHPLLKKFREKCFLFSSNDFVIPFLPGLYASIEKRWASSRVRGGFFAGFQTNRFLQFLPPSPDLPYLFSFVGSGETAEVRRSLLRLQHPRACLIDTAAEYQRVLHRTISESSRVAYEQRYAAIMRESKFILCPRGMGASSMRLFDCMRIGRTPVILSDQWLAPSGPSWPDFSIHLPESQWRRIPDILAEREGDAPAMGARARRAWEDWFAPPSAFHRVVEWCLQIKSGRQMPEAVAQFFPWLQFLRPFHLRQLLRIFRHG